MRSSKPISVTLGPQQAAVEQRVASGQYGSVSEVLRAGVRALEREEAALNEIIRRKVREAINDPRPSIPGDAVLAELQALVDDMPA
jgi:antitoxin ParD1/3/4